MLLQKERESVVEYGKKLITSGLTKGTGGNVSVLCREKGLFALSPSGMDYFSIAPEEVAQSTTSAVRMKLILLLASSRFMIAKMAVIF